MFQRFHQMKEEREGGFTLIELLVVILIIAILAAIAIPVFLSQREKGWISQAESTLKNAATAQESLLTSEGAYADTGEEGLLEDEGFKDTEDVTLTIVDADAGNSYCMEADHTNLDVNYFYDSDAGRPQEGDCA